MEEVKRGLLSVLRPGDTVTKEFMAKKLGTAKKDALRMKIFYNDYVVSFTTSVQKEPTAKERRMLTVLAWAAMVY